jgi:predicted DNA-binding protein with PD1-like motif
MQSKLIHGNGARTWALVCAVDEDPMAELTRFARDQGLGSSHFTGIGAFSAATLGFFDPAARDYERIPVREQVEVLALTGNIAPAEDGPRVHAHVVLGRRDGAAVGGHLLAARVRPTLELILREEPVELERRHDPATGLPLLVP